jgi:hypothetical protein
MDEASKAERGDRVSRRQAVPQGPLLPAVFKKTTPFYGVVYNNDAFEEQLLHCVHDH